VSTIVLEGSLERCMESTCPTQWEALASCGARLVDAGSCDAGLAACGITRPVE
jgi:hypothetical protein